MPHLCARRLHSRCCCRIHAAFSLPENPPLRHTGDMARTWTKFQLLLWKNWVLQIRHPLQTVLEILIPVIFCLLIVLVRSIVDPTTYNEPTTYDFIVPDNGTVPDSYGRVAWSPAHGALSAVMERAAARLNVTAVAFNTSEELMKTVTSYDVRETFLASVIFDSPSLEVSPDLPTDLTMTIRFPAELRQPLGLSSPQSNWQTNKLFPTFETYGPRDRTQPCGGKPYYCSQGFIKLQYAVSASIIQYVSNMSWEDLPEVRLQRYPYVPYIDDPMLVAMAQFVPLIIMSSFVYTCISTIKFVTTEKENQMKETLKIMGIPSWLHWTAWFIKTLSLLLITITLIVILLKVSWYGTGLSVFTYSNGVVLFLFFLLYVMAGVCFCFMVSVFFQKANTAATVGGLLWFLAYVPFLFLQQQYSDLSLFAKVFSSLAHNSAMSFGMQLFIMFEGTGVGLQWEDFWRPINQNDDLVVGHIMLMLIADAVIYMLIALYVEAVFPGEFGVPLPWYFFMQRSYWFGIEYDNEGVNEEQSIPESEFFEKEPLHLKKGIQIMKLRKVFHNNVAVDDLDLNMYEGQITVLLGHNGAGKTTTMSLLTGMLTPSGGTATVNGYDIRRNMQAVRDSLGLCPQHNVLFDELTVKEHLHFFAKLKGLEGNELKQQVQKYLKLLDIEEKANAASKTLSGGMKRKLSAGVALCGQSKVVLFDEPTAGMDPTARRSLWDVLKEEKKHRTILMTTHHMDEADIIGDRVAIMAGGHLCCCGSPFFLKKRYGAGYHLIIVKGEKCNVSEITNLLRKYIDDIEVAQNIGSELSYILTEEKSSVFESMLKELEDNGKSLDILSFGVSLTTMEEVFMRVGKDQEVNVLKDHHASNEKSLNSSVTEVPDEIHLIKKNMTGFRLKINQFLAMLMKRALYTKRTWILLLIMTIIPVFFYIIVIIIVRIMGQMDDLPALELSLQSYGENHVVTGAMSYDIINLNETYGSVLPVEWIADFSYDKNYILTGTKSNESIGLYETYKSLLPMEWIVDLGINNTDITDAILLAQNKNLKEANQRYIVSASFELNEITNQPIATGWFNAQPYHTPPLSLNLLVNAMMRFYSGNNNYTLRIVNHPLPYSQESQLSLAADGRSAGFQVALNLAFSLSYVAPFFVLFYIKERVSKVKLLQMVSGVDVFIFWCTAFISDFILFLAPLIALIITMIACQEEGFRTADELGRIVLMLVLFAWAMLPLIYLVSYLFTVPPTGYSRLTMIFIFTGVAGFMIVEILDSLNSKEAAQIIDWILLIIPHYSFSKTIVNMYTNQNYLSKCSMMKEVCFIFPNPCCKDTGQCPASSCIEWTENIYGWEYPGIARNIVFLIGGGFIFFTLLFCIELGAFKRVAYFLNSKGKPKSNRVADLQVNAADDDVLAEKEKVKHVVMSSEVMEYSIVLKDLTKYYGKFLAVDGISVCARKGECFGLLGVNGAGKSTTFKMLTGDEKISCGDAYVIGLSIKSNMKKVYQEIGYCPQFDALLEELTGYETLMMFCLMRGLTYDDAKFSISEWGDKLLLSKHIHKKIKEYSGGNKRKLSTALAMVGNPSVVYLDEPTAGMDPVARRHLWNVICDAREKGKCIVLTSHSMEECEALCTKLAIMVNGQFQCLGSSQHLKNKFAEGYTLTVKLKKPRKENHMQDSEYSHNSVSAIKAFINDTFAGAVLREEHDIFLTYYIPNSKFPWSRMFGIMEDVKLKFNIEDYSIGQTTLEQVFLSFARHQKEAADAISERSC
ncbi:phospholipid-transporting ATPase ABCA3 isoform X1 [Schistocerca gregaria]|uniref:phospholipid-transporting ATPase ABCA3 isoform X1 n=2 Tax=Schistocerca gregaria TaxID=7010 RepID=UPI00211E1CC1|nr:phospholipid-transporting ATPase ABCA3 isoform X1 [Schistocerca gregaria]